jgi:fatty-acyl-CoA synthase
MPAANAAALLRRNASDPDISPRPAVRFGERIWTHGEYVPECRRWANLFVSRRCAGRPFHVGVLLDNVPDYLFALGGAALAGAAIVGLNHTRRGENLRRDIAHTDVAMIVTEPRHQPLLAPIVDGLGLPEGNVLVSQRFADSGDPEPRLGGSLDDALVEVGGEDPHVDDPRPDAIWALVFTSGTSDAPKAVICSQRRIMVTGNRMGMLLGLGADDVGYISMPMFHSTP